MMKISIVTLAILSSFALHAQERNPFFIGHSLVNHTMPQMVQALALNAGKQTHYGRQIINGSPLHFNFTNAATAEGTLIQALFLAGDLIR
ncbi:MAG: hypothetical protein ACOYOA_07620 [Saprospiraceae bacterium]